MQRNTRAVYMNLARQAGLPIVNSAYPCLSTSRTNKIRYIIMAQDLSGLYISQSFQNLVQRSASGAFNVLATATGTEFIPISASVTQFLLQKHNQ